jgi:ATP-dependent DNA helicase MPH1
MSDNEENFSDFADEDLVQALSQISQTLPPHPRRISRDATESVASRDDDGNEKSKKKKYKIHEGVDAVPKASMCCLEPALSHHHGC